jgi:hypothetical protein
MTILWRVAGALLGLVLIWSAAVLILDVGIRRGLRDRKFAGDKWGTTNTGWSAVVIGCFSIVLGLLVNVLGVLCLLSSFGK